LETKQQVRAGLREAAIHPTSLKININRQFAARPTQSTCTDRINAYAVYKTDDK